MDNRSMRQGVWREQRGAALVEYILIFPLLMLLFLGGLEIFRLISVKQSLRTGLKEAIPCFNHWRDIPRRCDPLQPIAEELRNNPFTVNDAQLSIIPDPVTDPALLDGMADGQIFEVTVLAEVEFGFLYPFPGGPTITLRESHVTFIDSSPEYYGLNPYLPFPVDPGPLPPPS